MMLIKEPETFWIHKNINKQYNNLEHPPPQKKKLHPLQLHNLDSN